MSFSPSGRCSHFHCTSLWSRQMPEVLQDPEPWDSAWLKHTINNEEPACQRPRPRGFNLNLHYGAQSSDPPSPRFPMTSAKAGRPFSRTAPRICNGGRRAWWRERERVEARRMDGNAADLMHATPKKKCDCRDSFKNYRLYYCSKTSLGPIRLFMFLK